MTTTPQPPQPPDDSLEALFSVPALELREPAAAAPDGEDHPPTR